MNAISVPKRLHNPHPLVDATRRFYEHVRPDEDGRMRPGPREGVAHLIVSRATLGRALRFLQAIFREAERRGHTITPSRGFESTGISIVIRGHAYPVALHELHDRIPVTEEDLARWWKQKEWRLRWEPNLKPPTLKSVPNGCLKLVSPTWHGGRSSWSEGPRGPLDRKLPQFFEELERRADADDQRAEERKQAELVRQAHELELQRERERQALRQACADRLLSEVRDWREARDVRAYAEALRATAERTDHETRAGLRRWADWADDWANENDPISNTASAKGAIDLELPDSLH